MADPYLGEIRILPFTFAPQGWAFCDGQTLPLSQNVPLFSLFGTVYGGDGMTNFALPNLQGSAPIHPGPGLSLHSLGETGGSETVALLENEMPAHTHAVYATGGAGASNDPAGKLWAEAKIARQAVKLYGSTAGGAAMSPAALGFTGGDQPHNNMPPYLTTHFCIALQGVFPTQG